MVPPSVDAAVLLELTDMGFAEVRARKALLAGGMELEQAMVWLTDHADDADIDEPILLVPRGAVL
jgi:ubiquitin carboxyl-terminal hydrolase 5/13